MEKHTGAAQPASHSHFLDILRAVAISWVMLFHGRVLGCGSPAPTLAAWGWMGVDLFFVLSGYLITRQLLRDSQDGRNPDALRFYSLRAFRILPVYAVVLGIYLLLPMLRETPRMQPAWQFATFTENLLIDYSSDKAFSHVWSLCVEEQFYLLMPVALAFACRGRMRLRAWFLFCGILLVGLLMRNESWQAYREWPGEPPIYRYFEKIYYPGYNRMDGLLAGVAAACLHHFHPRIWSRLMAEPLGLLALTALLATATWALFLDRFSMSAALFGYPVLSLASGSLLLLCCALDQALPRFRLPGAATLARLAFSLYLSHKLVMAAVKTRLAPAFGMHGTLLLLTYVVCILLVGALLYFLVERPFLRLRDRLLKAQA